MNRYHWRRLCSFCGSGVIWRAHEADDHADTPYNGKGGEARDCNPHPGWIWRMAGVKIGLDGVVQREKHNDVNAAAEPGKPGTEKLERRGSPLGAQPVLFVRKIDQLDRQSSDEAGNAKHEQCSKHSRANEESQENGLGLPAVGGTAGIEVRGDDVRQPRIKRRKISRSNHDQRHEN